MINLILQNCYDDFLKIFKKYTQSRVIQILFYNGHDYTGRGKRQLSFADGNFAAKRQISYTEIDRKNATFNIFWKKKHMLDLENGNIYFLQFINCKKIALLIFTPTF